MNFGSEKLHEKTEKSDAYPPQFRTESHSTNMQSSLSMPAISDLLNKYIKKSFNVDTEGAEVTSKDNIGFDTGVTNKNISWNSILDTYMRSNHESAGPPFDLPVSTGYEHHYSSKESNSTKPSYVMPNLTQNVKFERDDKSFDKVENYGYSEHKENSFREEWNHNEQPRGFPSTEEKSGSFWDKNLNVTSNRLTPEIHTTQAESIRMGESTTGGRLLKNLLSKKETYFEYINFDDFATAMARPIRQQDVRSKLLELKSLVADMKDLKKGESDDKLVAILQEHLKNPIKDQNQPVYKLISSFGPEYLKKFMSSNGRPRDTSDNDITLNQKVRSSKSNYGSNINNPNLAAEKLKESNHSIEQDEFTSYLQDKNINVNKKINMDTNANINEAPNLKTSASSQAGIKTESADPQVRSLLTNLQFFLSQNLKETIELKELFKQSGVPETNITGNLSDFLVSAKKVQSRNESPGLMDQSGINSLFGNSLLPRALPSDKRVSGGALNDLSSAERRIHEGQTDRLIAKINVLNKQIEEMQKNKSDAKRFSKVSGYALKSGTVRVSRLVTEEFDLENLHYDDLESKYKISEKFLVLTIGQFSFYDNESNIKDPVEVFYSEIEEIVHIEINSPYTFVIKLHEKVGDEIKSYSKSDSKSKNKNKRDKKRPYFEANRFYIIMVEDPREFPLWDNMFFLVNVRLSFMNSVPTLTDLEIVTAYQNFASHLSDPTVYEANFSEKSMRVESAVSSPKNNPAIEPERQSQNIRRSDASSYDRGKPILRLEEEETPSNYILVGNLSQIQSHRPTQNEHNYLHISNENTPKKELSNERSAAATPTNISVNLGVIKAEVFKQSSRPSLQTSTKRRPEAEETALKRAIMLLQNGEVFVKYGTWGKPHEKKVRLSKNCRVIEWISLTNGKKSDDTIEVSKIIRVDVGERSNCFKKMKNNNELLKLNPERIKNLFSIVSEKRSLDLEAGDETRKAQFLEALGTLRNKKKESIDDVARTMSIQYTKENN